MKLSDAQRNALAQIARAEGQDNPGARVDHRTASALLKRGLVTLEGNTWYPKCRMTEEGQKALDAPPEPPRRPGRPRKHNDTASKQWAYRQRKEQRLDDLQKYVNRGRQSEYSDIRNLCDQIYGKDGQAILKNLVEYIKEGTR